MRVINSIKVNSDLTTETVFIALGNNKVEMNSYCITGPVGYLGQDKFLNRVIKINTSLRLNKLNKLLEYFIAY